MEQLEKDTQMIRALVRHVGTTAADVARKAKVAPSTIHRPYSGAATTRIGRNTIEKLMKAYPDFPGWEPDMGEPSAAKPSTMVPVQMLDFAYGMGGTYLDEALQEATTEHFPRSFLRNYTRASADMLYFAKGIGDSMMPTIHNDDLVLIDRSQDTPRMNDQVWAIARGDIGMIKRLRYTGPDASRVIIMSDNADVSDDEAVDGEVSVLGRVVAVIRRI